MNTGYRCCILPLHQKASSQSSPVKNLAIIVNATVNNRQVKFTTKNIFVQNTIYISSTYHERFVSYSSGNGTVDKISLTH
jgi:hypothetical protein